MNLKILYIAAHRLGRSPGQRFRFEQYLDYLSKNGFEYKISNYLDENDDKIFYSKGKYIQKLWILFKSIRQRFNDVKHASEYDIIFIYRDAIMIGSTWFEKQFHKSGAKLIFDFDDAIWFPDTSEGNINLKWLKKPSKVKTIISYSDMVFAGNSYLADYAKQFHNNVKIVPTTIDTDYYIKRTKNEQLTTTNHQLSTINYQRVCIGWTGSFTTMKHLYYAIPILIKLKAKYNYQLKIKVISDVPFVTDLLEVENCKWNKDTEVEDLSSIDIGIMPLPDDKWSKGKCGFKGLQYMALEIPAVLSAVGVNNEIIDNGVNGFLAKTHEDWLNILSSLIETKDLRVKIGKEGRKTVIQKYSFQSHKDTYLGYIKSLT